MPDIDVTVVLDPVEETDGCAAAGCGAVGCSSNRSARNRKSTAATASSRPRSAAAPEAQPSAGARTVVDSGAESRCAVAARFSQSGVGCGTIRSFHGRSGGYWTTRMSRGR